MSNVVFLLSHGHSGSTILDMILGSNPDVFSTGELKYLPWQVWRDGKVCELGQDYCTCGQTFKNCLFWNKVLIDLSNSSNIDIFEKPLGYKISFLDANKFNSNTIVNKIEKKIGTYSCLKSKHLKKLYQIRFAKDINRNIHIYNSILKNSDSKYVMDSSKDIFRYLMLSNSINNPKLIILIRNLKGVANSYIKLGNKNINTLIKNYLNYYNYRVYNIIKKLNPNDYKIVHYEKIMENTEQKISEIEKYLNVQITGGKNLNKTPYHIVAGNPTRYSKSIFLKPDLKWKKELNKDIQTICEKSSELLNPIFKEHV